MMDGLEGLATAIIVFAMINKILASGNNITSRKREKT